MCCQGAPHPGIPVEDRARIAALTRFSAYGNLKLSKSTTHTGKSNVIT
jgi:hypothetical protein